MLEPILHYGEVSLGVDYGLVNVNGFFLSVPSSIATTARLLRWEPETIVQLPEGVGALPFIVPGSAALMEANITHLGMHRVVLWSKHGVTVRSEFSVTRAADLIEYLETAAGYEYMNQVNGSQAEGLTQEELQCRGRSFPCPNDSGLISDSRLTSSAC